jgi:hypothetical protein
MKRILSTGAVVALSLTILALLFSQSGESAAAPALRLPVAPAVPAPPPVIPFATPPPSFRLADISNTLYSGPNTFNSPTQLFPPWTLPPFGGRFQNTPFPLIVATPNGIGPFWFFPPLPPPPRGPNQNNNMMMFPANNPNIITGIFGPQVIHFAAGAGRFGNGPVNNQVFIKPAGVGGGVGGMNGNYGGY